MGLKKATKTSQVRIHSVTGQRPTEYLRMCQDLQENSADGFARMCVRARAHTIVTLRNTLDCY
jgi:hypothetical protein